MFLRRSIICLVGLISFIGAAAPAAAQPVTIVVFGDSGPAGSGGISAADSYPGVLQQLLRARGINATVTNDSSPGDTTAIGLGRVGNVPRDAKLVITEFGSNDMRRNVTNAKMNENMEAIIKHVRANGSQVLVLGVRGIDYSAIATRSGATALVYPPSFRGYLQGQSGQHLSAEGHRKAAEWMLPTVLELLQRAGIKS